MNARSNGEREQIESGSATEVVMPACAAVRRRGHCGQLKRERLSWRPPVAAQWHYPT